MTASATNDRLRAPSSVNVPKVASTRAPSSPMSQIAARRAGLGVGQRLEQYGPHGAVDRGGGADAEREGDGRDDGEAGCAGQTAERVPQVGGECFDRVLPAVAAHLLPDAGDAAELEPRRSQRLRRREARGLVRPGGLRQVVLDFVRHFAVRAGAVHQAPDARGKAPARRPSPSPPP